MDTLLGSEDAVREAMAGWLGDAVLVGNNQATSFRADDYWADLDAVKLYLFLPRDWDALHALEDLYGADNEGSRPISFLRRSFLEESGVSPETAAFCINAALQLGKTSFDSIVATLDHNENYRDTSRFLRLLHGDAVEDFYHDGIESAYYPGRSAES